jgi:hypothetical protein
MLLPGQGPACIDTATQASGARVRVSETPLQVERKKHEKPFIDMVVDVCAPVRAIP